MNVFRKLKPFIAIFALLTLIGAGCGGPSTAEKLARTPAKLKIWRVFDDSTTMYNIMQAYRSIHPNVSIDYRELRYDEYEDELIRAFAEGNGPDIFSINNTWIGEYKSLIKPMPPSVTIPYSEVRGTIKKEVVYTLKEQPTMSIKKLKSEYVDVVIDDVVRKYQPNSKAEPTDKIFALPLALDTLAMYYNKDLLNAAGIPEPPGTWQQFQNQVTKLTKIGPDDVVLQAGAAMGTSKNVERAADLISVLMMQNGTQMTNNRGHATFASRSSEDQEELTYDAVNFYSDFANPSKQVYTWNEKQPSSFDAFVAGKVAFFFGYSYHADLIRNSSPKLKFSIAPLPQIDGGKTVNYANYWVETVAKSTKYSDWAWDFLLFATKQDKVTSYLEKAKKPTAQRALINSQIDNEDLSAFVSQVLTAKSWYKGKDAQVMEEAFQSLIDELLAGEEVEKTVGIAQNKINQTF